MFDAMEEHVHAAVEYLPCIQSEGPQEEPFELSGTEGSQTVSRPSSPDSLPKLG